MKALQAAIAAHQAGDLETAERGYRMVLGQSDADPGALQQARRLCAALLLQQGRDHDALDDLQAALALHPDDDEVAVNLAIALRRCGRSDEAAEVARRVAERSPGRASAWNAWGLALLEDGLHEQARSMFDAARQHHPDEPLFLLHRAHACEALGDIVQAERDYRAVLRQLPDRPDIWRSFARLLAGVRRHGEALDALHRAARLAGPTPDIVAEIGASLDALGRRGEAQRLLRDVVAVDPAHVEAWYWLGRSLHASGDAAGAQVALESALALAPDNVIVRQLHRVISDGAGAQVDQAFVRALYDNFALRFEATLVGSLDYGVPKALAALVERYSHRPLRTALDLGCGTGLMGIELARPGLHMEGVDLSPVMLRQAAAKSVYADLHVADLVEFLEQDARSWDLLAAADVLIYVGPLERVLAAARTRLAPNGLLAFSVERSEADDLALDRVTLRYRHHPDYLSRVMQDAGLAPKAIVPAVLRKEAGQPVHGLLVVAGLR